MNGQVPPFRVFTMVALTIGSLIFVAAIFAVFAPALPNAKGLWTISIITAFLVTGWAKTLSAPRQSQEPPVNPPAPNPDAEP